MKKLAIVLVMVIVSGCATTYQAEGLTGGFTETQLDTNVFIVRFKGNGHTSSGRASDFALLRSAELTLENGYKYFSIIDSDSYHGTISGIAETVTYSSYNTTDQDITFSRPRSEKTIIMFKEKPAQGMSYSAEFIYKSLRDQYGLNEK